MAFGNDLKNMIASKGITAAELSRRTGIAKTTLSGMFKSDVDKISIDLFLKICDAIGVDPEEFYRNYQKKTSHSIKLSSDETYLIELFRKLSGKEQQRLIGRAELLVEQHEDSIAEDA